MLTGAPLAASRRAPLTVWNYHERVVDAIEAGDVEASRHLLVEHMNLLDTRTRQQPDAPPGLTLDQRALFFE